MTNEEFQELVLEQLGTLSKGQRELQQSLARIENDHGTKITALFDGYTLRGDQIEKLQQHIDEKLDALLLDTNYLVSKSAQHDREIRGLKQIK